MPIRTFMSVDLPAPFSPDQGVDLALVEVEIDLPQGVHAGEALVDSSAWTGSRGPSGSRFLTVLSRVA